MCFINLANIIGLFAEKRNESNTEKLKLILKNRHLKLKILILFYIWENTRV